MKKIFACAVVIASMSFASLASAGPNLVTNGGFDGSAGWTSHGFSFYSAGDIQGHSGVTLAYTTCVGSGCASTLGQGARFGQNVQTVAGSKYDLSFWVAENGPATSAFSLFWNGALVELVTNPANNTVHLNSTTGTYDVAWKEFSFQGLVATASSTSFEIHGRHDPAAILFDDISVVEVAASDVPEPTSVALLGIGALALMRRRARK